MIDIMYCQGFVEGIIQKDRLHCRICSELNGLLGGVRGEDVQMQTLIMYEIFDFLFLSFRSIEDYNILRLSFSQG
jgi:hypothetical protein